MPNRNYVIEIPVHWSAEQADAVWEFLAAIQEALWEAYEDLLIPLYQPDWDDPARDPDDDFRLSEDDDSEIPF